MKVLVFILRILVGGLFTLSGLIKLNDPKGFAYKLEEYFSPDVFNLDILIPYSLIIAITIASLEVVLAIMLLLGYKKGLTLFSLIIIILFFTGLTFYSAYFDKVTDCGCFGDVIKLTPWQSFQKDIVLLVLITIIAIFQKYISPISSANHGGKIVVLSGFLCFLMAIYVLNYLPFLDFRPYKVGVNISKGQSIPNDAPKTIYEYAWQFSKGKLDTIIKTSGEYPDLSDKYQYKGVKTTLISKGYEPPIHDFSIEKGNEDYTNKFLESPKLLMIVAYNLDDINQREFKTIKKVEQKALLNDYQSIILTASSLETYENIKTKHQIVSEFYNADGKTLKTIIRGNPSLLILHQGTIVQKLGSVDFSNVIF